MSAGRCRMLLLGLSACALLAPAPSALAAETLADLMSEEDYHAAGLDRLSVEQRAHLLRWIERDRAGTRHDAEGGQTPDQVPAPPVVAAAPAPEHRATAARAESPKGDDRTVASGAIHARIAGEFSGWTGDTVFELDNGEVWQQRQPGRLSFHAVEPEVILRRNRLGFYSMEVPAAGRTVLVRRLR